MKPRNFCRIASALIIFSVLFSQLGLNWLHTHQGQPPKAVLAFASQSASTSTTCPACAMDGVPTLYVDGFHFVSLQAAPLSFAVAIPARILLPSSGPSLGRAPPVI